MNYYDSDTEIEDNQTCHSESNQNYQTQNGNVQWQCTLLLSSNTLFIT